MTFRGVDTKIGLEIANYRKTPMETINYGSILERDEVLSRSIVESIIPEDRREAFAALLTSGNVISDTYLSKYRVGFLYNCALIFAAWDIHSKPLNYVQVSRMVNLLNYRDSIRLFTTSSEEIQSHIYQMNSNVNSNAVNAYLRSVNRLRIKSLRYMGNETQILKGGFLKYGEIQITKSRTLSCMNQIKTVIHLSNKDGDLDSLDLSNMKKFRDWIIKRAPDFVNFGDLITPILVMWKAIYGEKNVIECLDRFSEEGILITTDGLMDILDDWTELSAYPSSWILAAGDYKIIDQ